MRKLPDFGQHHGGGGRGVGHSDKFTPGDPGLFDYPGGGGHDYGNDLGRGRGILGWMSGGGRTSQEIWEEGKATLDATREENRVADETASAAFDDAMNEYSATPHDKDDPSKPKEPPNYIPEAARKYVHSKKFRPGDDDNVWNPKARTWGGYSGRPAPDDAGPGGPHSFWEKPNPDDSGGGGPWSLPNPDDDGGGVGPRSRIWMRR